MGENRLILKRPETNIRTLRHPTIESGVALVKNRFPTFLFFEAVSAALDLFTVVFFCYCTVASTLKPLPTSYQPILYSFPLLYFNQGARLILLPLS